MKYTAYFISDSTAITAETLGNSLLSRFGSIEFDKQVKPYVDDNYKAQRLVDEINQLHADTPNKPILVLSVVKQQIREIFFQCDGLVLDIFGSFLDPLSDFLEKSPEDSVGKSHAMQTNTGYEQRIHAVHYALDNDDGARFIEYERADVILVGVSRSGKTPTCLYLGLQYGVYAANYPLTPEDLEYGQLPKALRPYRQKLFGLTIDAERLANIREERRANSRYASLTQCEDELRMAEQLMRRSQILTLNTTSISVEEISTRIIARLGLKRAL